MSLQLITIKISSGKKIYFLNKYYDKNSLLFFHFDYKKNVKNTLFIIKTYINIYFFLPYLVLYRLKITKD